eukprot:gene9477-biopygen981
MRTQLTPTLHANDHVHIQNDPPPVIGVRWGAPGGGGKAEPYFEVGSRRKLASKPETSKFDFEADRTRQDVVCFVGGRGGATV